MSLGKLAIVYLASVGSFLALDFAWLSNMLPRFYQPRVGELLARQPNFAAAVAFYVLYGIGIVAFAVVPGAREGALLGAVWRGALFGALAYATYNLTNMATLKVWPLDLTLIDMAWGTFATAAAAALGYLVSGWVKL